MPSRNTVKLYLPETYYHVFNRGAGKSVVFRDELDYGVFLSLLKRYLSSKITLDRYQRAYDNFHGKIDLVAYCLMPNHVHLFLYQSEPQHLTRLLQRLFTAYGMYFNERHDRKGRIFESVYKARNIDSEAYLWHITRYIHLNPTGIDSDWKTYPYSSFPYYLGVKKASWVKPDKITSMFAENKQDYQEFLADFADYKDSLANLADELADH